MATASSSEGNTDTTIDYAYDLNGYRTEKTVVTRTYETVTVHNYVTTVVAATCTEGGYTLHQCACGESYRTDETAALGHNYVESGLETYTCTRCGDTYTDHTHSYTTTVVEPTCTEGGYTLHACACGYSYRDAEVRALGHSFVRISQSGNTATFRCTRCGYTYTSGSIPVPTDPKPPIVSFSLGEDTAATTSTTGCGSERVLKSMVTEEHSYIYAGGRLLRETITTTAANGTVTTKVLDFAYDAQGTPYSLTCTNGTATPETYYYITNLQGDVTYLINGSGTTVARYSYDPYGQIQLAFGSMAEINPLRYRGYYYDSDTEFYYLQSRYYDAAICRFINADAYASTGRGFTGYNMFAYCNNNPVSNSDPTGDILISTLILIGSAIVGVACAGYTAYREAEAGIDTVQIIGDSLCAGFSAFSFVYTCGMSGYQCYQNYCYLNGLTPVTEIGSSTPNVEAQLQVCADKANSSISGKGPAVGTQKHTVFAEEVNALGNTNLRTEVSYKNGCEVPYGTKGSVRFDVMMYDNVGVPVQAWDFKTGAATLTASRIAQMQSRSGLIGLQISMIK